MPRISTTEHSYRSPLELDCVLGRRYVVQVVPAECLADVCLVLVSTKLPSSAFDGVPVWSSMCSRHTDGLHFIADTEHLYCWPHPGSAPAQVELREPEFKDG